MPTTLLASTRAQQRILGHHRWRVFGPLDATHGLHIHSHRIFVARRRVAIRWLFARMFHVLHYLGWCLRSRCRCCRTNWSTSRKWRCSRCSLCICWIIGSRWHWWCRGLTATCTLSLCPCHGFEKLGWRSNAREDLDGQAKVYRSCLRLTNVSFMRLGGEHRSRRSVDLPLMRRRRSEYQRVQRLRMRE